LTGLASIVTTLATLYVTIDVTIAATEGGGSVVLNYSVDGGSYWEQAGQWTSSYVGNVPISIGGFSNLSTVQIQLVATAGCSPFGYANVGGAVSSWYATVIGTGQLSAQTLQAAIAGLTIPSAGVITGIGISFNADYTGVAPSFQVGLNVGNVDPFFTLTTAPAVYTSGGSTSLWGYSSWSEATLAALQVSFFTSSTATTVVSVNTLVVTVYYSISVLTTDALDITHFGLSLPSTSTPQGLKLTVLNYATDAATFTIQMLKAGVPVGVAITSSFSGTPATFTYGGINDLFGTTWTYADLNSIDFGVRITAVSSGAAVLAIGYVTFEAFFLPSLVNFNYITTFEDNFSTIRTLALDADGNFWVENINSAPGLLTPLFSGIPDDSYASSFTADSRQFIAISDLQQGNYPPQGYNGTWHDRVSQVGPGAPPAFAGTLAAGGIATITSYTTSGGIVTLTAANTFTAGEVVIINILTGPTYLNGAAGYNVLGSGLLSSQFEVAYGGATGSGTATGTATGQYTYPIAASPNGITQNGPETGLRVVLQSAGPGSQDAGSVVTVYYSLTMEDPALVQLFQQQLFPVYVYVSGTDIAAANGTFQITNIGQGYPPNAGTQAWYFTYNVTQSATTQAGFGLGTNGQYQLTVATVTATLPLPGVQIGDQVSLSGNVGGWDETWSIVNALNSGSFSVSETSITAGVATYNLSYTGFTSVPPAAGQLITVTGCLNPAAQFNIADASIASVSWLGGSGTVTVTIAPSNITAATPVVEPQGAQATTSGTVFQIDPGPLLVNSNSGTPIYGNSGGGFITLVGSTSIIVGTGTRRGVVFFITRNGFYTAPSPYFQFSVIEFTNYILASGIPVGPADVIARGIAFTEAGQNGIPGASYYTIPTPVSFTVAGVTYLSSSLFINDNVTTTAKFTFPDTVLLEAEEIDIQGNDLFNLQELGDAAWCTQYAGRSVWGRVNNKIGNFINLSFDGGYLPNPGSNILPLGWGLDSSNLSSSLPTLLESPVFGNSYYIKNLSGSDQTTLGMITQSAFQDQNGVAILNNSTTYSVRVTCRTPGSSTIGALVIDLTTYNAGSGYGQTYGSFTLNTSAMASNMVTYTGTLLTSDTLTIPSSLVLRVWAQNLANNGDIEIDRIEVFPTLNPVNLTGLTFSYLNDWESFDDVTGGNDTSTVNSQPTNGAFVIHDQLYIVKESSLGYLSDSPSQEPANWNPFREVSNVAGACGINAYDVGEEWAIMAGQNGLFAFNGGAPVQIQLEIPDIWQAINWPSAQGLVVRNDVVDRKIFVACPMTTPNQWMPDFPPVTNPNYNNVILMLNYDGIGTIEQLISSEPLHVTLMGKTVSNDLRRKWSPWSIPTPYIGHVKRSELFSELMFCNGIQSSKIYELGDYQTGLDDGTPFKSSYCTYGAVSTEKEKENPTFGMHNKQAVYYDGIVTGSPETGPVNQNQANGIVQMSFFQNTLTAPSPYVVPGGLDLTDPNNDIEGPLDEYAQRLFVELSVLGGWFRLSRMTIVMQQAPWSPLRGK
jgi:hypothetical protein